MEFPATTDAPAIELLSVEKRYPEVTALAGLTLRVPRGCFFGLLGPNGAGKTTAVSILATLARADAGSACLFGTDVGRAPGVVRPWLGIVFQESSLDRQLTAREHLELQGRLYRLAGWRARSQQLLVQLGLLAHADRPVRRLSGGLRRRVELARALMHRPRLMFLDEPTVGLDVATRTAFWTELRSIHAGGETTIFLTTHSMEEAEGLCERVGILDAGRLVVEGEPESLRNELGGDVVRLELERSRGADSLFEGMPGVTRVVVEEGSTSGCRVRIVLPDGSRRLAELLERARPFGVREVTFHRPTLEHVFLHHTGHPFEPEPPADGSSG